VDRSVMKSFPPTFKVMMESPLPCRGIPWRSSLFSNATRVWLLPLQLLAIVVAGGGLFEEFFVDVLEKNRHELLLALWMGRADG